MLHYRIEDECGNGPYTGDSQGVRHEPWYKGPSIDQNGNRTRLTRGSKDGRYTHVLAMESLEDLLTIFRATDWADNGWNLIDSIELCHVLKALGVDLIDVSSGGAIHNAKIAAKPGFQVPFATAIRTEANIPTAAVGLITEPEQAEHIITTGEADAVFLARAMLRNPRWALMASEKGIFNQNKSTLINFDSTSGYQNLIQQLGRPAILKAIDSLHYGKGVVSADMTKFWSDNSLRITPDEQLGLIKRLYFNQNKKIFS